MREEPIPHLPHRLHVELLAVEDDLPALLVLPGLEIARHVHPADDLLAAQFVRLADDEIHVHRLADPVFEVAVVLHVEDLAAVAFAGAQVGVPALELDVDALPAGLAVVVLELHFAIDAVVEHRHRAEDLVRLARDGHHVADEDLLQRLRVEFARGRLVHRQKQVSVFCEQKAESCARRDRSSAAARLEWQIVSEFGGFFHSSAPRSLLATLADRRDPVV